MSLSQSTIPALPTSSLTNFSLGLMDETDVAQVRVASFRLFAVRFVIHMSTLL